MADNKKTKEYSRRDFLKTSGAVTGGFIGGSLLGGLVGFNLDSVSNEEAVDTSTESDTTLNNSGDSSSLHEARLYIKRQEDFETLSVATELIFPEDNAGPGAIELGVPYFIDRQLATTWAINSMDYMNAPFQEGEVPLNRQKIFVAGLRKLSELSNEEDKTFAELSKDEQISLLTKFEKDEIELDYISSSVFFNLLRQSTIEGVYADPLYGGNKNMAGWKMKEYPGAQMSYRDMLEEDESIDEEFVLIEPISLSYNS